MRTFTRCRTSPLLGEGITLTHTRIHMLADMYMRLQQSAVTFPLFVFDIPDDAGHFTLIPQCSSHPVKNPSSLQHALGYGCGLLVPVDRCELTLS